MSMNKVSLTPASTQMSGINKAKSKAITLVFDQAVMMPGYEGILYHLRKRWEWKHDQH